VELRAVIETARLRFRSWREDDRELAERLWGDPEVTRFTGAIDPAERLAKEIECERAHGIQYWPMFLKADGDFAGCCGLRPYREGIPEFGVHVARAHWRKGLATEAANAVIRHAFDRGAEAIFAGHNPNNDASRAMLRALGFHFTHEELYPPTGLVHPSYVMRKSPKRSPP
jgi:RimJ/RimL family protein N-acetyltransferase